MSDDFILGILDEKSIAKSMKERLETEDGQDVEIHPENIMPQDIVCVGVDSNRRDPRLKVAVKPSKLKNSCSTIDPLECENPNRKSDVYIFAR